MVEISQVLPSHLCRCELLPAVCRRQTVRTLCCNVACTAGSSQHHYAGTTAVLSVAVLAQDNIIRDPPTYRSTRGNPPAVRHETVRRPALLNDTFALLCTRSLPIGTTAAITRAAIRHASQFGAPRTYRHTTVSPKPMSARCPPRARHRPGIWGFRTAGT